MLLKLIHSFEDWLSDQHALWQLYCNMAKIRHLFVVWIVVTKRLSALITFKMVARS